MDNSFSERTFLSKLCDRGCPSWGICHCTGTSTSAKVGPIYHLVKVHPLSSFCLGFGHPFTPKAPSWSKWGWWSICSQQVACLFWNWGLSLCLGRPSQVRIVCARSEPWSQKQGVLVFVFTFLHLICIGAWLVIHLQTSGSKRAGSFGQCGYFLFYWY